MTDTDSTIWDDLRRRIERLEPGTGLVTPVSERLFTIETTFDDHIAIRFRDSEEERHLWRDQFERFGRRLDSEAIATADLSPSVEPYTTLLTLLDDYTVDGDALVRVPDGTASGESPYLVSPAAAQTRAERLHDDSLLLANSLSRLDGSDPTSLDTDSLTDLYVLLSDVQHEADRLRQSTREPLLNRLGPDQELQGRFGTIRRTVRERQRPKNEETVLDALDDHGIPHEWVLGVDTDKLDVVLAVTDLTEEEVYDTDERVYVQKITDDENEKYSRLQELANRIDRLEDVNGEELRKELTDLEARLDEALSA